MNVLCVGGVADGRRVVVPDGKTHLSFTRRTSVLNMATIATAPIEIHVDHYNLFQIHPVTRAVVFALASLTPTQVMETLMDGYRQEHAAEEIMEASPMPVLTDELINKIVQRVAAGARLALPHREMCAAVWELLKAGAHEDTP